MTIPAPEALDRILEGNRRFAEGAGASGDFSPSRREGLAEGQAPLAVVLGCADSRVPPEVVFDQGLGDLFVVRVAGTVVGASVVGSIEFAAEVLGTRLILVLGHSACGAVGAAGWSRRCSSSRSASASAVGRSASTS